MELLIVSGFSGSGKSIVLDTLEDCGYYCVDNLPVSLLEGFINHIMAAENKTYSRIAIGVDARNPSESLLGFSDSLKAIKSKGIDCEVLFLQAEESVLFKRYSETRRKHPLTSSSVSLPEALKIEKKLLKTVLRHASVVIDTSRTHIYQLRELIKKQIKKKDRRYLSIQFQSFAYKHGIPLDADFVFDARCLANPYWEPELRTYSGRDEPVIDFLKKTESAQALLHDICFFLDQWLPRFEIDNRSYLTIAVGCTGGQHRSVYLVESLVSHFKEKAFNVIIRHRELH